MENQPEWVKVVKMVENHPQWVKMLEMKTSRNGLKMVKMMKNQPEWVENGRNEGKPAEMGEIAEND